MRKHNRIKKYLSSKPETLNAVKHDLFEYAAHIIPDEDIPEFEQFVSRSSAVKTIFEESNSGPARLAKEPWYKKKALLVTAAAVFIVTLFMGFTPIGHAVAETVFKTVVQWFDSGAVISHEAKGADAPPLVIPVDDAETTIERYDSFDELRSKLGYKMVRLSNMSGKPQIEVTFFEDIIEISSAYVNDAYEVYVTQTIYPSGVEGSTGITLGDAEPVDVVLPDNTRFIGHAHDGFGSVTAYKDDMQISLYAVNTNYESFVTLLEGIVIE